MPKRSDHEPQIRQLWMARPAEHRTGTDLLIFYGELQDTRPDLLSFKASGDKYQVLKTILRGLISE